MPADLVLATLRHLCQTLKRLDLSCALIGGLALAIWKHPRFTKDVDLLVALGDTNTDNLLRNLIDAGFRAKRTEPFIKIDEMEFLQLLYEPEDSFIEVQIDLLLVRTSYQQEAIRRRIPVDSTELEFEVDVLACEDLIVHKLLAGRMIDLADSQELLRANRSLLDVEYLARWINNLGLRAEFEKAWEEAFPGEQAPV
ncbi:MAG: nucleotidyl transferase AbiEii/AbiGii toxin family protein [Planctomycetota bacterium]|nr:nucleotidyl transferase AbiEii/AbiGii toxin family protein [Planctomycetota bacterium]